MVLNDCYIEFVKYFIIPFLFFFLVSEVDAQPSGVAIVGKVVNSRTGDELIGTTLHLVNSGIGTSTDTNGYFRINLERSTYSYDTILVSHLGFKSIYTTVGYLKENKQLALEEFAYHLDEVVVLGSDFKIQDFMYGVIKGYVEGRRKDSHIARSYYFETAQKNGRYIAYMESLGYSVYMKLPKNSSPLANFKNICENTRCHFGHDDWLKYGISDSIAPFSSASALQNCFRVFETRGVLHLKSFKKYRFELESRYKENNRDVFKIGFNGQRQKGSILVDASSSQIIKIFGETNSLFSSLSQRRLSARYSYELVYFSSVPFISKANAQYRYRGVDHRIKYVNLLQKLDEFEMSNEEFWELNAIERVPEVMYDSDSFKKESPQKPRDYSEIEQDLLEGKGSLESYFEEEIDPWLHDREEEYRKINDKISSLRKFFRRE